MLHHSTADAVRDLDAAGMLLRVREEVDPRLMMASIHLRVNAVGGPALLFERVKGSPFQAASNLFGTMSRAEYLFRHTLRRTKALVKAKADPAWALARPGEWPGMLGGAWSALPRKAWQAPVLRHTTTLGALPAPVCWPRDGGPFITLPQVCSVDVDNPGILRTNLGMYRVQLGGNQYEPGREVGLHYQIHRGLGVHHAKALAAGKPLKVSVFVGGPPAHAFAAVMPLPEALPEVAFAGVLAGFPFRYTERDGCYVSADADFCITGTLLPHCKPEGPFGDHLGYYSEVHDFPVLQVEHVYHRDGAIWPFTVVGRPPQEDSIFGALIHEIASPMAPVSVPGLRQLHAVDAAGVHPLALAVGAERYVPYGVREPMELLTIASAVLGFNQVSLAKYLFIAAEGNSPAPDTHNIAGFLGHMLERVDFSRDLHFTTRTTMDTLDYSGTGVNRGSKLVMAAAGPQLRTLGTAAAATPPLPAGFRACYVMPGVLAVSAAERPSDPSGKNIKMDAAGVTADTVGALCEMLATWELREAFPLVVLCDDAEFVAARLENFLWVTFTRSNPSHDVHGVRGGTEHKHWGCDAPLVIDARIKPHHAPVLELDAEVERRVDQLFAAGGSLAGKVKGL